ncbi:MAG: flavodoxin family protein [Candidatus Methanomethylophilus sp.]|nr:flavodoxin family protein [Methanomethylophilus sp.]MDD3233483.1 flavodoxin family protein [Methanomethylophilus sp.]MDD4222238.1 flavodoxin family protein [Methanomethylophilus sp.]MDD4668434.1 flavodoxin family protein [Methanomethylophilus sp.]
MAKYDVIVLCASPLISGNSAKIAAEIVKNCETAGKKVHTIFLNKTENLRGCQSCYGCKKAGHCVVKDGTAPILDEIREAEAIVLATPTYFGEAAAQLRLVTDRFFSFLGGDFKCNLAPGKKAAVVVSCGSGYDGAVALGDKLLKQCGMCGFTPVGKIVVADKEMKQQTDTPEVQAEAKKLAAQL